jgi:hypothetical protein
VEQSLVTVLSNQPMPGFLRFPLTPLTSHQGATFSLPFTRQTPDEGSPSRLFSGT